MCKTCGHNINCDNCDVTLTYHNVSNNLKCHYCGFSTKVPKTCSMCGEDNMINKGDGTQQIEESIKEYFQSRESLGWTGTQLEVNGLLIGL